MEDISESINNMVVTVGRRERNLHSSIDMMHSFGSIRDLKEKEEYEAASTAPGSSQDSNYSTWSQLFLRRTWIENGFDDDADFCEEEETITMKELCSYSVLKVKNEICAFCGTCKRNPLLLLRSSSLFVILCGCGLALLYYFKEHHIQTQKEVARNIAIETGDYYSEALSKTVIPMFSLGQIVKHDENFLSLSKKIGVLGEEGSAPMHSTVPGYRNITGICDDEQMFMSFDSLVRNIKQDAHLADDRTVTILQLAPQGVFCLLSPRVNYKDFGTGKYQDMSKWIGKDWANPDTVPMQKMALQLTLDLNGDANPLQFMGPMSIKMSNGDLLSSAMYCVHLSVQLPEDTMMEGMNVNGVSYPSWGLVQAWINWEAVEEKRRSKIDEKFESLNFDFKLSKHVPMKYNSENGMIPDSTVFADKEGNILSKEELVDGEEYTFMFRLASSSNFDEKVLLEENSVVVPVATLNSEWTMTVLDIDSFYPSWYMGTMIAIVFMSFFISVLFLIISVERSQHNTLLYKMMPKKAIRKLNKGKTVVEKYNMVTIFFSDIVGFTSLAASMRPVEIMKMLNDLYVQFDILVEKHGLYKVETIGDAYMVLGGAPNRNFTTVEAAEKVALFALDAIEAVKKISVKTSVGKNEQIFIRAGLASGPVVAGVVGNAMPRYCLFGDTVNFASRMESTSVKMRIQCCDTTGYLLVNSPNKDFDLKERVDEGNEGRAGVHVKGKGWTHTYWIKGSKERSTTQRREVNQTPVSSISFDLER